MHETREPPQLGYRNGRPGGSSTGLLARILAIASGALVLMGAIAISIVVFAVVLAVGLVIGLYLWWKTRHFRRQMREQMRAPSRDDDSVIEGEVIRKDETRPPT